MGEKREVGGRSGISPGVGPQLRSAMMPVARLKEKRNLGKNKGRNDPVEGLLEKKGNHVYGKVYGTEKKGCGGTVRDRGEKDS